MLHAPDRRATSSSGASRRRTCRPVEADPGQLEQVAREPGRERPRRDAHGRQADDRDCASTRTSGRRRQRSAARAVRPRRGRRHGLGHRRRDVRDAPVRAVLHDEGAGQGDRTGARDGLRHRRAERRLHSGGERGRPGHALRGLPARVGKHPRGARSAAARRRRRARDRDARRGRAGRARGRPPDARAPGLRGARRRRRRGGARARRAARGADRRSRDGRRHAAA